MKILVIGLDGATPERLFGDERLVNIRHLMIYGCYGLLQHTERGKASSDWVGLATSQPGSFTRESKQDPSIWDQVTLEGGHAILVDVPPASVLREIDGISVRFSAADSSATDVHTYPASIQGEIIELVGEYSSIAMHEDVEDPASLKDRTLDVCRKHFAVVRHLVCNHEWDYFQFVESGLARLQRVWRRQEPEHEHSEGGHVCEATLRDYYGFLDNELGSILEALDEDAIVLVVCLDQTQPGAFVLAAPHSPLHGEIEGVHVLDVAPTLLDLAGLSVPGAMQGRSLVMGEAVGTATNVDLSQDEEEILRERLSGLGYL